MPKLISSMIFKPETIREGKGFSISELKAAEITPGQAKTLGIPVDARRKSSHDENIDILKEFIGTARESGIKIPKPKQTAKGQRGRAERGLTSSGKKLRGIVRSNKKN